jgi:carbonic anhydrase/acetyltransferase-like protein (isoleucine patch superfamily)
MIESDVKITGDVRLGNVVTDRNSVAVSICGPSEISGSKGSPVIIGEGCDIASYVVINVSDSSRHCVGKSVEIERGKIEIGEKTFIGTAAVIIGPCRIGRRVRIGAQCFIKGCDIPDDTVLMPQTVALWGAIRTQNYWSKDGILLPNKDLPKIGCL